MFKQYPLTVFLESSTRPQINANEPEYKLCGKDVPGRKSGAKSSETPHPQEKVVCYNEL